MNERQEKLRRAAAQEFFKSLDQLQEILKLEENEAEELEPQSESLAPQDYLAELEALEEAATDIEQYMQELEQEE